MKKTPKKINLLETTLRDGSYAINYSFTSTDTALICRELENVGFEFIEIGHGAGLSATPQAVSTDEEYMVAASKALKKAKWGMFCIPGIAKLKDLDLAAKYGMGFVRIGTNVTHIEKSEKFIQKAKGHGMFVAANYMKSYASSPEEFAKKVKLSEKYGADIVYIVDSAGGMFPENIRKYFKAIRKVSDIPLGFHGHDNLGLAVANSLEAVTLGIDFVDSSLQGLGRSSGNAPTEILVSALLKKGYNLKVDLLKMLDLGQQFIQPLITQKGRMPLDIISGYADFHSSYMPRIQQCSANYNINPLILIVEMCKRDKVNLDKNVMDQVARKIKQETEPANYLGKYNFSRYSGGEQDKI